MEARIVVPGRGRPYLDGDSLDHRGPLALTIMDVLSPAECARLIEDIDARSPTVAPVSTSRGAEMMPDVRNNERVMVDDAALARDLFERIRAATPSPLFDRVAVGVNERLRCYRYRPGQRFAPHYDGAFRRDDHERSELTFMIYLNEGFGGGATRFHDFDLDVVPRTGMALLFQHHTLHEGCIVTSGTKYALRTDVMYRD